MRRREDSGVVLIVDDERQIRRAIHLRLEREGYTLAEAGSAAQARAKLREKTVSLVLLDFRLPDANGLELLKEIKAQDPAVVVIMMTAHSSVESAVEVMREGAYHYLNKPLNLDELTHLTRTALETTALRQEVKAFRATRSAPFSFSSLKGESPAMASVVDLLRKVAASPSSSVLLTGESGTGKDLAAKAIHYNSSRADGEFVNITCTALSESLLETELFGHEKGAFTGAKQRKKGLLEVADGGTAYLDEIGDTDPGLQAKLLRFLEEKAFKRVGGTQDVRVDVRVVAATNRDLKALVRQGRFREDLFYRLRVMPIVLPPLRQRPGDIAVLLRHFVEHFRRELRKNVSGVSPAALKKLESYPWPGNIRELRNAVERAMLLAEGDLLGPDDFRMLAGAVKSGSGFVLPPEGVDLAQVERDLIVQALARTGGNQTRAAALLGLNRDQIRYRVRKFGLNKESFLSPPAEDEVAAEGD